MAWGAGNLLFDRRQKLQLLSITIQRFFVCTINVHMLQCMFENWIVDDKILIDFLWLFDNSCVLDFPIFIWEQTVVTDLRLSSERHVFSDSVRAVLLARSRGKTVHTARCCIARGSGRDSNLPFRGVRRSVGGICKGMGWYKFLPNLHVIQDRM